jgi:hypothetical protein
VVTLAAFAGPILRPVPDPVPGRQLVTREPGQRGQRDRNQIRHVMRMDQPRDRLISGQRRGGSTRFPWGFNSVP